MFTVYCFLKDLRQLSSGFLDASSTTTRNHLGHGSDGTTLAKEVIISPVSVRLMMTGLLKKLLSKILCNFTEWSDIIQTPID